MSVFAWIMRKLRTLFVHSKDRYREAQFGYYVRSGKAEPPVTLGIHKSSHKSRGGF